MLFSLGTLLFWREEKECAEAAMNLTKNEYE